ncbi:hypothetical protein JY794_14710, partial [Clostridioides difficile]|nr:hypothetical protein [Clostridioides difficile]
MLNSMLDLISKIGISMVIISLLYFMYRFLFSFLLHLNKYTINNKFYLSDVISVTLSILTFVS